MASCIRKNLLFLRTCCYQRNIDRRITMSAKLRAEEALEELKKKNPYYEKYSAKLAKLQQTSPEEFLNRIASVEENLAPAASSKKERNYSELLNPKPSVKEPISGEVPFKKLSDIMKLDLLQDKTAKEIEHIWLEYHKQKDDVLVATIPTETYNILTDRSKEHPIFIIPLPRSQGYEFFLLQFATNSVHFTPLLCYQVHKENAPECLNVVHYTEFSEKLGIVLMRGEYDVNVINAQEAQCLVNQLQLYYSQSNNQTKLDLLKKFTHSPDGFKHMDVINELENLSIK